MKMDGYVIVPPVSPWDEKNKELIWLDMAYRSFDKSPTYAWHRFTGYSPNDPDRAIKIMHWFNRGYRVKKATLEIHDEND